MRTLVVFFIAAALAAPAFAAGTDKTLVSWFCFDEKTPEHCSVITLQAADKYEAIAFGHDASGKWSIASDGNSRTQSMAQLAKNPAQEVVPGKFMMMAAVYKDNTVTIYRDGEVYASYTIDKPYDFLSSPYLQLVIGQVRLVNTRPQSFKGKVVDVRVYAQALSREEIVSLKPNEPSDIPPFSWLDFSKEDWAKDQAGKFPEIKGGGASKVNPEDHYVVLKDSTHYIWSIDSDAVRTVRDFRQRLMNDPTRPTYHLLNSEGDLDRNYSADPNIFVYWKGQYHFSYMNKGDEYAFGHYTSTDLVHWRRRGDSALGSGGAGTGGTVITKDGKKVLFFSAFGGKPSYIEASDENLEEWSKPIFIKVPPEVNDADYWIWWDPTAWVEGDYYYLYSGSHAGHPGPEKPGVGKWYKEPTLMRSKDLESWEFLGKFMASDLPGLERQDFSCADFFKLGNKQMKLLISHGWGVRYYLGEWKDNKFTPEFHAKMAWSFGHSREPVYWAHKTYLTPDGRRVAMTLLRANLGNTLWSGTFSLPWELSLPEDGILRMKPARELERLRYDETAEHDIEITAGGDHRLKKISGDTLELKITIKPTEAKDFGVTVLCDQDNRNGMKISYSPDKKMISLRDEKEEFDPGTNRRAHGDAPFELKEGEDLNLRIFIDRPLVEIFINDRQAVVQRHFHKPEDVGICLYSKGGDIEADVTAWKMAASNQW
jgi:beta-fructofuranosidase